MADTESSDRSQTSSDGDNGTPQPDLGAPVGGAGMQRDLGALVAGLGDAAGGGAPPEQKRDEQRTPVARQLTELSGRVMARFGALFVKAIQVPFGLKVGVDEETSQLLGECTVDLMRHSSVAVDPATEARWRWLVAHAGAVAEVVIALWEKRLGERAAKVAGNG